MAVFQMRAYLQPSLAVLLLTLSPVAKSVQTEVESIGQNGIMVTLEYRDGSRVRGIASRTSEGNLYFEATTPLTQRLRHCGTLLIAGGASAIVTPILADLGLGAAADALGVAGIFPSDYPLAALAGLGGLSAGLIVRLAENVRNSWPPRILASEPQWAALEHLAESIEGDHSIQDSPRLVTRPATQREQQRPGSPTLVLETIRSPHTP